MPHYPPPVSVLQRRDRFCSEHCKFVFPTMPYPNITGIMFGSGLTDMSEMCLPLTQWLVLGAHARKVTGIAAAFRN